MTVYTYSDELFSDFHKDAFGFRPSSDQMARWNAMSPDEKQDEWEYLDRSLEKSMAREREEDRRAVESFNGWIDVTRMHAGSEEDALRWITQDQDFAHSQDIEGWVWKQGILFTDRGREVFATLKRIWQVEY